VIREQEYIKLKSNYRELKNDKNKTDAQNEQRIEQYNNEIRENKEENTQLQNTIKELEDQIQELVNSFSKIFNTNHLQTMKRVR
jgi:septal ring factor EnvC (AmiA/AmiB activator)